MAFKPVYKRCHGTPTSLLRAPPKPGAGGYVRLALKPGIVPVNPTSEQGLPYDASSKPKTLTRTA